MSLVAKIIAVFGFPVFLYMGASQAPNLHIRMMQGESLEEVQQDSSSTPSSAKDWDEGPAVNQL